MTPEKILVPLDGSDLAEAALETAIDEQPAAMLVLLRAAEASRPLGSDRTEKPVHAVREAESYLNGVVAGLREAGGEWGEPADGVAALSINFLFYGLRSRTPEPFRYLFCALESEPGSSATCRSRSRPMRCSPASMRPWRRADARASAVQSVVAVRGRPTMDFYRTKQRALATDNVGGRRGLWRKA